MGIRLITVAACLAAMPLLAAGNEANEVTHPFNGSVPGSSIRRVIIHLPVAQTTVVATTGKDIRLEGTTRHEFGDPDEQKNAQTLVDGAAIVLHQRGRTVYVERQYRGSPSLRERNATKFRFTLFVPQGTSVEIEQRVGEVTVKGAVGDVDLDLNVGHVWLEVPKKNVGELLARSRIGEVTTNLPDRTIMKQGVFAGATHFLNEGGTSVLRVKVNVGEIAVTLQ